MRPDEPAPRPTSRGWYLVGLGLLGSAAAIAFTGFMQMRDSVEGLQRRVIPGSAEVTLTAGRTTLYLEHRSVVAGTAYDVDPDTAVACTLERDGKAFDLRPPRARVTYSLAERAGRNLYDVDVPSAGTYVLACRTVLGGPAVIAVGGGIGAWLVVALVGGLLPGVSGLVVIAVVFLKRRRPPRP